MRFGLACLLLAGCVLPPPPADDFAESWSRPDSDVVRADPREWFTLQGQAILRDPEAPDGVDDSAGVAFVGGWDLIGERVRLALEGEVGWSRHDTNWTPAPDRSRDDLDLLLVGLGLRVWFLPSAGRRFAPYVRAGGFGLYALDDVDDEFTAGVPADFDETVYGGYVGGGRGALRAGLLPRAVLHALPLRGRAARDQRDRSGDALPVLIERVQYLFRER